MQLILQLFGRVGRGGSIARAHLFFNPRQKNMDSVVKAFCLEGENCRRKKLLEAVGSSERIQPGNLCCDGCVGDSIPLRLQFDKTSPVQTGSKRRVAAHDISYDMKSHIKANLVREGEGCIHAESSTLLYVTL